MRTSDPKPVTRLTGWLVALIFVGLATAGCKAPSANLMPTPNLYAWGKFDPFKDVPPALQNNKVDVLYYTDRQPENKPGEAPKYGFKRSRSGAFGISTLEIGNNVAWSDLVKASRTSARFGFYPLNVTKTVEMGRFSPTPPSLVPVPTTGPAGEVDENQKATEEAFSKELSHRLSLSPVKEVDIYVHGVANAFEDSVQTIGQLWHFFGRRGVPIAYSWPAGSSGLRSYLYDRESSEFTVYHLRQLLMLVASNPDVERINILAHSRGTDVATSALRELNLQITGSGRQSREVLKLQTMVLAAPDLDFDVIIQRLATARLGTIAAQSAIFVCSEDKALGLADWLFQGVARLGQLKSNMFSQEELEASRKSNGVQIIDVRVTNVGDFGHNYFHANSAVSSDLILMMRYHLSPGWNNGRPLRVTKNGFWTINDDYPTPTKQDQSDPTTEGK